MHDFFQFILHPLKLYTFCSSRFSFLLYKSYIIKVYFVFLKESSFSQNTENKEINFLSGNIEKRWRLLIDYRGIDDLLDQLFQLTKYLIDSKDSLMTLKLHQIHSKE